jgi:hypothetical protein
MRASWLMFGVLGIIAGPAAADDGELPATFHKGQFGVSARLSMGVRGIATYENNVYCGTTDPQAEFGYASVCTGRTPLALDLEASYGITPTIDLVLEMRLGIETDFGRTPNESGPRPFHLSPGARFFFSDSGRARFFVQPQLLLDFTGHERGNDFGVRGIEGLWIDLHRAYGVYVYVAESLAFNRWLSASFEAGFGFQGRYP